MDGQHQYEINLKKDDLFICLSSDDVYFISKQMDKWCTILLDDSYVPTNLPQRPAVSATVPVQPLPQQPQPMPEPVPQQVVMPPVMEPQPQPQMMPQQPMPMAQPVAANGGFIHPAQAQVPQPQIPQPQPQPQMVAPMQMANANELMAQQLMAQNLQLQALQQQMAVQQAQPQPMPQPQMVPQQPMPQAQPQPTLQDVLDQVGQPNLPSFVSQQPPVQQTVLNNMPVAAGTHQDVNLPMAQAPVMPQQPVLQQSQPMPQPLPLPMPEAVQQPIPQAVPQQAPLPPVPMLQAEVAVAPQPEPVVEAQPQPQPVPKQTAPQPVAVGAPALVSADDQDDFEAVMNSLLRDFEGNPETPNFASDAGTPRERVEPDLSSVTSLADLCDRSDAANSEDYLLLSAYYLTRIERLESFSLKKVNSLLVKSGLTPVNHSVLETVLSNGYLSMLPDLTGTAEVTEYQISKDGISAAISLL